MIRHPWDEWLSRKGKFNLVRHIDFESATHGMAVQLRTAAKDRNKKISILIRGDVLVIEVTDLVIRKGTKANA